MVVWLTGLPCSGKTTIAKELLKRVDAIWLDGDSIRGNELYKNNDFSKEGRRKHILMMGMFAKTISDQGHNVICSFVSPELEIRKKLRDVIGEKFSSIFVNTYRHTCIERDVKGMWKKALNGEIKNFTGVDSEYDTGDYDLIVNTDHSSVLECVEYILLNCFYKDTRKYCMFVGRWNGTFHNGHDYIIQKKLDEGKNVLLAVRDVKTDDKNPWSAKEVKSMLEYRFKDNHRVKVIIVPDIESIEYGRGVGYEVNEIKVEKDIAGISGTKIRDLILRDNKEWMNFVPKEISEYINEHHR